MNTRLIVTILLVSFLFVTACGGTINSSNPVSTQEPNPLPDEIFGDLTIDWQKGLEDPANAALAIIAIGGIAAADDMTGVGVVDDPVAVILIAGVAIYAITSNPELIVSAIEATVTGVQGVRDWVLAYAVPTANEGEQEKEEVQVNPRINTPKRIAHVDDDALISRSISKTIIRMGGVEVTSFISCEELLAAMTTGSKFDLYIVDNNLGFDLMIGPACVIEIQTLHPGAMVIGFSGGENDPGFMKNGARRWLSKETGPEKFIEILKELLK